MADSRVTVIAPSTAALRSVKTPYFAFEHPFIDRPGRYARQADALDYHDQRRFWTVGDVWPAAVRQLYTRRRMASFVTGFGDNKQIYGTHLWPEGVLYRTRTARLCPLDERIVYRPQAAYWSKLYELATSSMTTGVVFTPGAIIEVPDRLLYPHDFKGISVELGMRQLPLTVIVVIDGASHSIVPSIGSLLRQTIPASFREIILACCNNSSAAVALQTLSNEPHVSVVKAGGTRAAVVNAAIARARGHKVALWDLSCIYAVDHLATGLDMVADIVGGVLGAEDEDTARRCMTDVLPYGHTTESGRSMIHPSTMIIDRRVFDRIGSFDPVLSVQYGYEFQLRALGEHDFSFARFDRALATRQPGETCSEEASYGLYTHFVARDITLHYYMRDGAHRWIR